jgi:hypothetical protein
MIMTQKTPAEVVQQQLEAYNAHDLEAFMATYSPTIQIRRFPDGDLLYDGAAAVRERYEHYFRTARPQAHITGRMVRGAFVIDYEQVYDPQRGHREVIALYEVRDGLIQRVWFLSG